MRDKPHFITQFSADHMVRCLCLCLFFLVQTFTISHAAEFNQNPHEHHQHHDHHEDEGVPCSISLIAPEVEVIMPPAPVVPAPHAFKTPMRLTPFASQRYIYNECRAPPGRAPPATSI